MRSEKPLIGVGFVRNAKQKILPNLHRQSDFNFLQGFGILDSSRINGYSLWTIFFTEMNFLLSNSFRFLRLWGIVWLSLKVFIIFGKSFCKNLITYIFKYNFLSPFLISDWLIFCCEKLMLCQKNTWKW